jgi:hypothetical protein
MSGVLAVVPCGKAKVWDRHPGLGATPARDAYTGALFRVHRAYAERFADRWVILSAKYGFMDPDWPVPGTYDVTFNNRRTNPVGPDTLRRQISELGLGQFSTVIGLGGAAYRAIVAMAFEPTSARLIFPFAGLNLFQLPGAVRRALADDSTPAERQDPARQHQETSSSAPRHADFQRVLDELLDDAVTTGQPSLDLSAGELHRRVGGYPGRLHRMPLCCEVMRSAMGPDDVVLEQPPSGKGASLRIRYDLARRRPG